MSVRLAALRQEYPRAPWEIQDEVELWARERGRTATLHMAPNMTWFVRLSLRVDDPRMKLFREGLADAPPTEDVWLHIPNPHDGKIVNGVRQGPYIPLDIYHLGASGVREFLEQGDTWSGRGRYQSLVDQLNKTRAANAEARANFRQEMKEENRHEQRQKRRFRLKIPFLPVGIDLRKRGDTTVKEK